MLDRRRFVSRSLGLSMGAMTVSGAGPAAGSTAEGSSGASTAARAAAAGVGGGPEDEDYWAEIARAFPVDRSLVNLNNGGVHPASAGVQAALKRHLDHSNQLPGYTMTRVLGRQRDQVRAQLARAWGVDAEEIALTRNASESLNILQLGLDLQPGDELLTTDQDYPRMLSAFRQRERREGLVLRTIPLPVPAEDPDEVVARFEAAITPRTRVLLCCHMIYLTGQVLPVKAIAAMARRHGVETIVDGAHAFAHLDFRLDELEVDFYAASLHKWLAAPHGTGLLYVRRGRIRDVWPLQAADESLREDIRKFEQIGTHPSANVLAIADALQLHEAIGGARKAARLEAQRERWLAPLESSGRLRCRTSRAPGSAGAIATVSLDGIDDAELVRWLWGQHRILTISIDHPDCPGVRVSPSIYTTPAELGRFSELLDRALKEGLPDGSR